jgi:type I restriction enzyme S subunit
VSDLPNGWVRAPLDAIADLLDHEREPINSSERETRISGKNMADLYPYYGATGQVGLIDSFRSEGQRVLLGEDAAPFLDHLKDKAYLTNGRFWVNNHAHVLAGAAGLIDNKFICHQLNTVDYHPFVTGSTRLKLTSSAMKQISMVVAPAAEQTRIVAKLEELLSDLDAGVAELKAAQTKLAQYRQSLLKAAVEGALTAEWGAKNTPTETGAQLLKRILTERRACWEAKQLAKFAEQGKIPPKDWQKKYPEPVQPDTTDLPGLPEGWVWATLSQIGWLDRGRSKHRPRNAPHLYGGPYPFVQTGDIRHADTFLSDVVATYSEAGLAQSRLWPVGTMCITIAANIGKTAILSMEACFPDSVVGFLADSDDVLIRYVEYFMRSAQQKLEDEAPATAQKNINLEILEKVAIPVPPTLEQHQIVKMLEDSMGSARESDQAIDLSLKQSTAQRQNILRAAFTGQLVPQDPNDEPASVLLDRIRAERVLQEGVKKPRRRKTKESLHA